jgi:hypothetical protein
MAYTLQQMGTTIWSVPYSRVIHCCPTTTKSQTWQDTITIGEASKALVVLPLVPQTRAVAREVESSAGEVALSAHSTPTGGGNEFDVNVSVWIAELKQYVPL